MDGEAAQEIHRVVQHPIPAEDLSVHAPRAVEELPPEQADILRIFYFEEKPHSVIAEELGLPLGTVKSRLRLALGRLRRLLEDGA